MATGDMIPLFYRSNLDGWRTGVATEFTNASKVTVYDIMTSLQESVLPKDIYIPDSKEGKQLIQYSQEWFAGKEDDVSVMSPTPLESLPSLIQAIRSRYATGKDGTLIGDNVLVCHRNTLIDTSGALGGQLAANCDKTFEHKNSVRGYALRLAAAHRSEPTTPQVVHISGDRNTLSVAQSITCELSSSLNECLPLADAAMTALKPFLTTFHGDLRAYLVLGVFPQERIGRFHVGLLDTSTAAPESTLIALDCGMNYSIFSYIIHGFSNEEKEQCMFPREFSESIPYGLNRREDIDSCRLQYLGYRKALDSLGIHNDMRNSIGSRMSAVIQLLEVEFNNGYTENLTSIKNVARALQIDFNGLAQKLNCREDCRVLASFLYHSTVLGLINCINSAMNPNDIQLNQKMLAPLIFSITPSSNSIGSGRRALLLRTMEEDLLQCYLRTSEEEIVQWQRSGFAVSDALQCVFDTCDNYSLLKVLRINGGVLASAQMECGSEEMLRAFSKISKHKQCYFDANTMTLMIQHSSGEKHSYQLVTENENMTMFHSNYLNLKEFVMSTADVYTRESLMTMTQNGQYCYETEGEQQLADSKVHSSLIAGEGSSNTMMWWVKVLLTSTTGTFDGCEIEGELLRHHVQPITMLRKLLSKRFIPCSPEFIIKEFMPLCSPKVKALEDSRAKAEGLLHDQSLTYLIAKDVMLIEARTVMKLYEILNTFIYKNACVVQSFARSTSATLKLNRRVAIWEAAIGASMSMITSASEAYRTELDNRQVYHVEILDVQENEQTDRANIQDQCWVEWIAIQTDMQTTLEKNAKSALAGYLTQQHDEFKAVMSVRQIAALDDLANRVQERIMLQGAHLDGIVVQKVKQLESAKKRISTMRDAHNRRMQMLTINEEQKLETRQMIDKKGKAADRVALEREKKSAKLREEQWMRHERDRVTRIEMERTREAVAEQMRERFIMEGIEYTVAKRLAIEVTDRNRRIREEEELMMKREREERENEFKENEKKAVLEALKAKKGRHDEISLQSALKKKEVYRQWTAQERERKAVERLQKIEAIQNKKMTSSLLASHSLLESPMIFDQSGNRHISVRSKADRSYSNASTGFSMSNGRTVYSRIVPKDSLDAVIKFFGSKGNSNSTISDSHHRAKNP